MHHELAPIYSMKDAGLVANQIAGTHVFDHYLSRRSENTVRAHLSDLTAFCEFLNDAGIDCPSGKQLQTDPAAWRGVTWGLVQSFVKWCLAQGVAISTVNRRLSTVKAYSKLAAKVGIIGGVELALIKDVSGYGHKERNRVDERRDVSRVGAKKADNVSIDASDASNLKDQPDTAQGRRDRVLICLLLDHGLRVGEVAELQVSDVDLKAGELHFWREKVQKQQRHRLTRDTAVALQAYMQHDQPVDYLLRGSRKGGALTDDRMSVRAINNRVRVLGESVGIDGLSPHDCRHYWATRAIQKGTDPFALQQAGGWSSLSTVRRYVDELEIANEGVFL